MKTKQFFIGLLVGTVCMLAIFLPICLTQKQNVQKQEEWIFFGEYAQTLAAKDVTFTNTEMPDGTFLGSDGQKYVRVSTTALQGQAEGTFQFFKIEKLKWRVLSKEDNIATLMCSSIIDGAAFQPYYTRSAKMNWIVNLNDSKMDLEYKTYLQNNLGLQEQDEILVNNYKFSYLRYFLNEVFYQQAFSADEQAKIVEADVDNSAKTTLNLENKYFCENTLDHVFLLSCADATSKKFGFAPEYEFDACRGVAVSDYAQQMGVEKITNETVQHELKNFNYFNASMYHQFLGTGMAWLRSPSSSGSNYASTMYRGCLQNDCTAYAVHGVVPVIKVRL